MRRTHPSTSNVTQLSPYTCPMADRGSKSSGVRQDRREAIARAAVEVLATQGLRGLTHRAVDAAAGFNPGAVNYHAPTREHLLLFALDEVFAADMGTAVSNFSGLTEVSPLTKSIVVERLTGFVHSMTLGDARNRVLARLALMGEAQINPVIRERFDNQRAMLVSFVAQLVDTLDPSQNDFGAEMLVVAIEGLIQRQVTIGAVPLTDQLPKIIEALLESWDAT